MQPTNLTLTQQIITLVVGLFGMGLLMGTLMVHTWVLIAWKRIMTWSGWLKDRVHDRIGLLDLIGCFVFIVLAQFALAGVFYKEFRKSLPTSPVPIPADSPIELPAPAWINPLAWAQSIGEITESPWFMFAAGLSLVVGSLASAIFTLARTRSTPGILGMTSGSFLRNIMVGVLVFFWITPMVMLINIGVSQLTEIQYQHPVIDSLRAKAWGYPLLFASAVIFAPLWEEYAFRFLLINWLDTLRHHGLNLKRLFLGNDGKENDLFAERSELFSVTPDRTNPFDNADAMNSTRGSEEQASEELPSAALADYPPWWVAIVSGVVFGLAHFEYGVSWVPLCVLGVVLARVYQLQRSVLPCFIIHALFNSLAMIGFAVELFVKPAS
ncbi:MAG: lysostaphin resistance A-like protein [Pirellula sp.]